MQHILKTGTKYFPNVSPSLTPYSLNNMNKYFINDYFNCLKKYYPHDFKNTSIKITDEELKTIFNMDSKIYKLQIPTATQQVLKYKMEFINPYEGFNSRLQAPFILHIFNDHNVLVGYYVQKLEMLSEKS